MFDKSIQYLQSLIIKKRRLKKCRENQARHAWERTKQLKNESSFNLAFTHILHDVALYGNALSYADVIHGMALSLEEESK